MSTLRPRERREADELQVHDGLASSLKASNTKLERPPWMPPAHSRCAYRKVSMAADSNTADPRIREVRALAGWEEPYVASHARPPFMRKGVPFGGVGLAIMRASVKSGRIGRSACAHALSSSAA